MMFILPTMTLPGEFLLVAACCRWPLSEPAVAAIRDAAARPIDWAYVLRIVARHRVAGLAGNALRVAGIAPPQVASAIDERARRVVHRNLKLADETIRLQGVFDQAGIPVLVLKGAPLAVLGYGSLGLKHGRDIDLLVTPDRALTAMRLLEGKGYSLCDPASRMSETQRRAYIAHGREAEFMEGTAGVRVELHWRLAYNAFLLRGVDAFSKSRAVALQGRAAVRSLGDDDLFAYLCVHGASHAWFRLKWLADLNALISTKDEAEVAGLYRYAQGVGAGFCAGQALMLCRDLLGLQLPKAIEAELEGSRRVRRLAAHALRDMTRSDGAADPDPDAAALTRDALMHFRLGKGLAFYAAQVRFACIASADVIRFPLPPALYFLYPVLRLPSWIVRHLR